MSQPLLKHSVGEAAVNRLAHALQQAYPEFATRAFRNDCLQDMQALSLKQRVQHIIAIMHRHLPADFNQTAVILHHCKQHWKEGDPQDSNRAMAAWPLIDYIAAYGQDQPHTALPLLKHLTPLFSAEFAIQPFILRQFETTRPYLQQWCHDADHHVRRLVSEGMRPRLPWGQRMQAFCQDPSPILPLLEALKSDSSAYVRKSVANNLNDISKDNPQTVIQLCQRWQKKATPQTRWIIRHGTRSLVKQGHPAVFPLLGYTREPQSQVNTLQCTPATVNIGQSLQLQALVHNPGRQEEQLVIDYALFYLTASGKQSRKVFKLTTIALAPGQRHEIRKTLAFKPLSTRRYYPGPHQLELLINGRAMGTARFTLVDQV